MISKRIESLFLQYGRIHKDAEMEDNAKPVRRPTRTFNVDAPIKMRKLCIGACFP